MRSIFLFALTVLSVSGVAHAQPLRGEAATPANSVPYQKTGICNCTLPGTSIEFSLDGRGGAQVAKSTSNYAPFKRATQTKRWSANLRSGADLNLLILDNGSGTRIMVRLPDGRGIAFIGEKEGGASDILCQVLVSP